MKRMTHAQHLVLRARLPILRIKRNKAHLSKPDGDLGD
jgi:hypothetical protein